jgi:hypothetical protein
MSERSLGSVDVAFFWGKHWLLWVTRIARFASREGSNYVQRKQAERCVRARAVG